MSDRKVNVFIYNIIRSFICFLIGLPSTLNVMSAQKKCARSTAGNSADTWPQTIGLTPHAERHSSSLGIILI